MNYGKIVRVLGILLQTEGLLMSLPQFRGGNGRQVDSIGNHLAFQYIDDFFRDGKAYFVLSFVGAGTEVGRHDTLGHLDQRRDPSFYRCCLRDCLRLYNHRSQYPDKCGGYVSRTFVLAKPDSLDRRNGSACLYPCSILN